jgi:hypothetical protein
MTKRRVVWFHYGSAQSNTSLSAFAEAEIVKLCSVAVTQRTVSQLAGVLLSNGLHCVRKLCLYLPTEEG